MNKCIGCGLDFRSLNAFDAHRVFDVDGDWKTRRCLTATELVKLGMGEKEGGWGFPVTPERAVFFARKKNPVTKREAAGVEYTESVPPAEKGSSVRNVSTQTQFTMIMNIQERTSLSNPSHNARARDTNEWMSD